MPAQLVENFVNGNRTSVVDAILQDTNSRAKVAYLTAEVLRGLAKQRLPEAKVSLFMDMLYSRAGKVF